MDEQEYDPAATPAGTAPDGLGTREDDPVAETTEHGTGDPTRWVREMLVSVLGTTEAVSAHEDQGQSELDSNEGLVYFTDQEGLNYELKVTRF